MKYKSKYWHCDNVCCNVCWLLWNAKYNPLYRVCIKIVETVKRNLIFSKCSKYFKWVLYQMIVFFRGFLTVYYTAIFRKWLKSNLGKRNENSKLNFKDQLSLILIASWLLFLSVKFIESQYLFSGCYDHIIFKNSSSKSM